MTVKIPAVGFFAPTNRTLITKYTLNGGAERPETTWLRQS